MSQTFKNRNEVNALDLSISVLNIFVSQTVMSDYQSVFLSVHPSFFLMGWPALQSFYI